jgi:hypothetical protein
MIALLLTASLSCDGGWEIFNRIKHHPQYTLTQKIALIQTLNTQLPQYCQYSRNAITPGEKLP